MHNASGTVVAANRSRASQTNQLARAARRAHKTPHLQGDVAEVAVLALPREQVHAEVAQQGAAGRIAHLELRPPAQGDRASAGGLPCPQLGPPSTRRASCPAGTPFLHNRPAAHSWPERTQRGPPPQRGSCDNAPTYSSGRPKSPEQLHFLKQAVHPVAQIATVVNNKIPTTTEDEEKNCTF